MCCSCHVLVGRGTLLLEHGELPGAKKETGAEWRSLGGDILIASFVWSVDRERKYPPPRRKYLENNAQYEVVTYW